MQLQKPIILFYRFLTATRNIPVRLSLKKQSGLNPFALEIFWTVLYYKHKNVFKRRHLIYPVLYTVGAESLCRCRWKVRYLKPLNLWSQMTLKCFHYDFERWICRPLSLYNMNCLEFVIFLLPVPKVNKLRVPIFLKKKEILPLMGGKIFFSTEDKCYFMGWGEYGVKSKDIVARVGPSQRAEICRGCWRGAPTPPFPPWWHQVLLTSGSI